MQSLIGCQQEPAWHPEGDVWVHTLMVIDEARARIDDLPRWAKLAVMLGAVCHDFGKPATTAFFDGRIRSHNHEEAGVPPARALLDRLNVHSIDGVDVRVQVCGLTAHHLKPGSWYKVRDEVGDGAFRRLAQKVDLELLARLAAADCVGRYPGEFDCTAMTWFVERARSLGVEHEAPRPLLLGRHLLALGLKPGPRIGEILKQVYERQLDGREERSRTARRREESRPQRGLIQPARYVANCSGSTLPPLMSATTGPRPSRRPASMSAIAAATVIAPLGSATTFAWRNSHRIAEMIAGSSIVTTRSTKACTCGNVTSPGRTANSPSAIPIVIGTVTG